MTRSKNNGPPPDPEHAEWMRRKGSTLRLYDKLVEGSFVEGILIWFSAYWVCLEFPGGRSQTFNKAFIARHECIGAPSQVRGCESERDTNGVTAP